MRRFFFFGLLAAFAAACPLAASATRTFSDVLNRPESAVAVTQVFGDGLKLTGVALKYAGEINESELDSAVFKVPERTVVSVSLADEIDMSAGAEKGKYVILHLSPDDKDASLKALFQIGNGGKPGKTMPTAYRPYR